MKDIKDVTKDLFVASFGTLLAREPNTSEAALEKVAKQAAAAAKWGTAVYLTEIVADEPPTPPQAGAETAASPEKKKRGTAKGLPAPSEAAGQ